MSKVVRMMIACLLSLFALGILSGCAKEDKYSMDDIHRVDRHQQADEAPTGYVDTAEAYARTGAKAAGYGVAWVLNAAGIIAVPLLIMFLIPGLVFGRAEKLVEGGLLVVCGVFFYWLATECKLEDLQWCALIVNLIPGGLLLVWGLISEKESGKFILLGLPVAGMALWLIGQVWVMVTRGLVLEPILTIVLLVAKLVLLSWLLGRREGATA